MKIKNLEMYEGVLIVVDMVNGFVKKGPMATPYMEKLIPEIDRLIKLFNRPEKNRGVIFIKEAHNKDCIEFGKFPGHCIEGTDEAEIIDEFSQYKDDALIFGKNSRSGIFAPGFLDTMEQMKNLKEIVIAGGCTDLCSFDLALPLTNYFDQENRNVQIVFPKNANDTYDAPNHNRDEYNEMAYKLMRQEGIQIVKRYENKIR